MKVYIILQSEAEKITNPYLILAENKADHEKIVDITLTVVDIADLCMKSEIWQAGKQAILSKAQKVDFEDLFRYSQIDGGHHKAWTIDRMARILLGDKYDAFIKEYESDGYSWDKGIAP